MEESFEILRPLLEEDETIYLVGRCQAMPICIIGPYVDDIGRKLDISGCIEETLHRMIENGCSDEEIRIVLDAQKGNVYDIEDGDYYIDLYYIIREFYPVSVDYSGILYERPQNTYSVIQILKAHLAQDEWVVDVYKDLDVNFTISEDANDEEVFDSLRRASYLEKIALEEDSLIIEGDDRLMDIVSALDFRPLLRLRLKT